MRRSLATINLTKDYIESKVSQERILSTYLDIPIDVVLDCINNNHLIESVFRNDDTNKSMGIQYNNKGRLKVRDFGGFGFFDDVYGTVAYVLSAVYKRKIDTNIKSDFYFVLTHIVHMFSEIFENKAHDETLNNNVKVALNVVKHKRAVFNVIPRNWNKQDNNIWGKWNIDVPYLSTHFVIPVEELYVNSQLEYTYNSKDPAYAYYLGKSQSGDYLIKIYYPLRNRKIKSKFMTNCNVLEGIPNLECDDYDYILITKSSKDRLSLGSYLDTLLYGGSPKIGIINVPSENYHLKGKEYDYLCNKLAPDGKIITFFDFDTTGRLGALYHKETYNIPYIFITNGELGLANYGAKDFTDLHLKYDKNTIIEFINKTILYVKHCNFPNKAEGSPF